MRRMNGRNDSRYEQFEISPETIEQELPPVVCEQQQIALKLTLRQYLPIHTNYSISNCTILNQKDLNRSSNLVAIN